MEVYYIVRKVTAALHAVILIIKYMKNLRNYFLKIPLKFLNQYYGNQSTLKKTFVSPVGNWTQNLYISRQPLNNRHQIYFRIIGFKTYL